MDRETWWDKVHASRRIRQNWSDNTQHTQGAYYILKLINIFNIILDILASGLKRKEKIYMCVCVSVCVCIIVFQWLSNIQLFLTPLTEACQASLSFTISWSLLKLVFIEWAMPSNLSFSFSPFSSHLQSFPASGSFPVIWHFASGGHLSFSISPSNEYSRLISFRSDWFDLLAVQGILKNLRQHHNWKESILHCSDFFTVQHSHPYMTTGKPIALTIGTQVGKVMSLLF